MQGMSVILHVQWCIRHVIKKNTPSDFKFERMSTASTTIQIIRAFFLSTDVKCLYKRTRALPYKQELY